MGYVMNGIVQFSGMLEGKCPGGPPRKGVWFKMTVEVRESSATISLDGKHLITANPHFHVFSRGGSLHRSVSYIFIYLYPFTSPYTTGY